MSSAGAPGGGTELLVVVGAPKRLICAILSTPGTMNAVQDFIKCVEALCIMHIRHAVLVSGGIVPQCPLQELQVGVQNYW